MHRPRLLILDEPTNGLDPLNQQEFDRMVKEVRADGRTVFLSSHILTEVEQTCSRVAIIREGRLVRVGGVAELKDIKRHEVTITFADAVPVDGVQGAGRRGAGGGAGRWPYAAPGGRGRAGCGDQSGGAVSRRRPDQPGTQPGRHLPALLRGRRPGRQGGAAMWFSSIYLKTLRDYRIAILGWGMGLGLLMYAVMSAVPSLVDTPEARAALVSLAGSFSWMAEPVTVDTPGGYATWKYGLHDFGDGALADPGGEPHAARRGGARLDGLCCSRCRAGARGWRWKSWPLCGRRCWRWAC